MEPCDPLTDKRHCSKDGGEYGGDEDDVDGEDGVRQPSIQSVEDGHLESRHHHGTDRSLEVPHRNDGTGKRRDPTDGFVNWQGKIKMEIKSLRRL